MTDTYFGSKDFLVEVAKGNVPGHSYIIKFGENPDVDSAAAEDIWDFGGTYTFSATAAIDSVSSSAVADGQALVVIGLDANYLEVSQTVTLNGRTRVALATNLIRVYRMYNNGATDFAGNIYCYENAAITNGVPDDATKVRAYIAIGNNQTLMTIYTVPAGKTAYLISALPTLVRGGAVGVAADLALFVREYGKVFLIKGKLGIASTGTSGIVKPYRMPARFPEKSDIKVRCLLSTADNLSIAASLDILLVDN